MSGEFAPAFQQALTVNAYLKDTSIPLVDRLRYGADRGWRVGESAVVALFSEAADRIEELTAALEAASPEASDAPIAHEAPVPAEAGERATTDNEEDEYPW